MPRFTIASTFRISIHRQRSYQAETLSEACYLAIKDHGWKRQKEDHESVGATYVTGAWPGDIPPDSVRALPIPSQYGEALQRKADHFEILLGLLKIFVLSPDGGLADETFWRRRACAAIAKAEAILAGARDPNDEGGVS